MSVKVSNFQIDNMQVNQNEVIMGPKKSFDYLEKSLKKRKA